MSILNYIIWNGSPEIFSYGSFSLRWYGLFFALGFLISQQFMYYFYKQEGKPEKDVDTLTIYMVIATIIGARLGHVIFYQPEIITENPLSIFLPFEFSPFRFTGLQGLASHGATIGILTALWIYSRKKKPGQTFLQVVDRIVIVVALTGALIRLGNYFNSEIIGLPTTKPWGVVFVNRFTETITDPRVDREGIVESVVIKRNDSIPQTDGSRVPLNIYIFFKEGVSGDKPREFTDITARNLLTNNHAEYFDAAGDNTTTRGQALEDGNVAARISTLGIVRHPAQLYESISCVFLFLFLFWLWSRQKEKLPAGRLL
ncbi:MAG TPA: prolipoprotein diacylglyceryl transferase, partial [Chryseolinea sp.]|nr:prolipoprotein diacylglyceryl transferase [Chryseolinea sp.]